MSDNPREVEDAVLCDRDARNSEWLLSRERREEGEVDRSLDWSAKASCVGNGMGWSPYQ